MRINGSEDRRTGANGEKAEASVFRPPHLEDTMGTATGELEHAVLPGGWSGTDDAVSTAPSDQIGNPPMAEAEKPIHTIAHDLEETIQLDEELQQERAMACEEKDERALLAEATARRKELHRLAEKVRAARKK